MESLQDFIIGITLFINNIIIPFLFGLALLFFIFNAFRYLILGAGETNAKDNARNLALYGIGAFVLLVSIWGIVNLLVSGLGFDRGNYVQPDFIENTRNSNQQSQCQGGRICTPDPYNPGGTVCFAC